MTEDERYVIDALDNAFVQVGSAFGLLDSQFDEDLEEAQTAINRVRKRLTGEPS